MENNNELQTKNLTTSSRKKHKKVNKPNNKVQEEKISREEAEAPKSFIITRGSVTKKCAMLRDDLRDVFGPYTAAKLKERKTNTLKDFEAAAKEFGVTHIISLSQNDFKGTMLRIIRLPNGPTFWFNVKQYTLLKNVVGMQKKRPHYKYCLRFFTIGYFEWFFFWCQC